MTVINAPSVPIVTADPAAAATKAARHSTEPGTTTRARSGRPQPGRTDHALIQELMRKYHRLPAGHADRAKLRTQIVEASLPMARRLARRYAGRGEPLDDLSQVAALALIKAVDRYDPDRQVPFASFAHPSILGALKRHFRDTAWAMRIPRRAQELTLDLARATAELSQQLARTPTTADLAGHLHVTADDITGARGASQYYCLTSLNTSSYPGPDSTELIDLIGDTDPHYPRVDNHLLLRPLFAALPLRERRILTMRFFGDMSQAQIAATMGLSQMHVSRLLTQSLIRLRAGTQR